MRFKIFPAIFLFLGSYFPLSIILLLQDIDNSTWKQSVCVANWKDFIAKCNLPMPTHPGLAFSTLIITLLSLIGLYIYLESTQPISNVTILEIKSVPNDLVNYVFPYVVSFMGLSLGESSKLAGALVFLIFMFVLTYRSGEIIMNPILLLFGWRIYEVKGSIGNDTRIFKAISKERLYPDDTIGSRLAQDIYILKNKHTEEK